MGDSESEALDSYQDIDEAWNVKAKFAYDMLEKFSEAWELMEIAEKKHKITPTKYFLLNRIYRPLQIYFLNPKEAKTLKAKINSGDCEQMASALVALWEMFAIDLGHVIPKKKEHKLRITDRYRAIRTRTNERDKKRASLTN